MNADLQVSISPNSKLMIKNIKSGKLGVIFSQMRSIFSLSQKLNRDAYYCDHSQCRSGVQSNWIRQEKLIREIIPGEKKIKLTTFQ